MLVSFDYGSMAMMVYPCVTKDNVGMGLKWVAAEQGWSKLPYKVTVYADNCGSMTHLQEACTQIQGGAEFKPLPPHHPNRNEAEKVCNTLWAAGRHYRVQSHCPAKYFRYCV